MSDQIRIARAQITSPENPLPGVDAALAYAVGLKLSAVPFAVRDVDGDLWLFYADNPLDLAPVQLRQVCVARDSAIIPDSSVLVEQEAWVEVIGGVPYSAWMMV